MAEWIELQQPGDVIYTMTAGRLRAWVVNVDGDLVEVDPAEVSR
jgi:hypothetical protein